MKFFTAFPADVTLCGAGGAVIRQTATFQDAISVARLYLYATQQAPLQLPDASSALPDLPVVAEPAAPGLSEGFGGVGAAETFPSSVPDANVGAIAGSVSAPKSEERGVGAAVAPLVPAAALTLAERADTTFLADLLQRILEVEVIIAFGVTPTLAELTLLSRQGEVRAAIAEATAAAAREAAAREAASCEAAAVAAREAAAVAVREAAARIAAAAAAELARRKSLEDMESSFWGGR